MTNSDNYVVEVKHPNDNITRKHYLCLNEREAEMRAKLEYPQAVSIKVLYKMHSIEDEVNEKRRMDAIRMMIDSNEGF
jgi:hypothetical protein